MSDPTPKKSLRQQWAELSLEKKLSIFFAPVFVALLGVFVPRLFGADSGASSASPGVTAVVVEQQAPEQSENLDVIGDPVVLDSTDEAHDYGNTAEVEVLVRNTGTAVAVIHSAEFRVEEYDAAEVCVVPQGELGVSSTYDVALPGVAAPGEVVKANLAQQIPAGEADRFSFRFRLEEDFVPVAGVAGFYLLAVRLYHDDAKEPLDAGRVLIALPFPTADQFTFSDGLFVGRFLPDPECPPRNLEVLNKMLALPAERAADLEQAAADYMAPPETQEYWLPEPTALDSEHAIAAADTVAGAVSEGDFQGACDAMDDYGALMLEKWANSSCPTYLQSLAASHPAEGSDPPEITESHRGWFKLVAPTPTPGSPHQFVLIVEGLPTDVVEQGKPYEYQWLVTNVYDSAQGPLESSVSNMFDD